MRRAAHWLWDRLCKWLMHQQPPAQSPLCDFSRLCYELRAGDIVLVEGRSRVSEVIKLITQSSWTHSALYIGRLCDLEDQPLQKRIREYYQGDANDRLLVEAQLGEGTVITPLHKYREDHLRICRPDKLSPKDAHAVISYTIERLGSAYDVRQLLDLARFFFPWAILPRRWRSSLFQHNAGSPTRTVCSCLLAEAFSSVDFPILPFIERSEDGTVRFFKRNPKLFTPKDFDYSPYFHIIKYPFLGLDDQGIYRKLPWADRRLVYNDDEQEFDPGSSLPPSIEQNDKNDIQSGRNISRTTVEVSSGTPASSGLNTDRGVAGVGIVDFGSPTSRLAGQPSPDSPLFNRGH